MKDWFISSALTSSLVERPSVDGVMRMMVADGKDGRVMIMADVTTTHDGGTCPPWNNNNSGGGNNDTEPKYYYDSTSPGTRLRGGGGSAEEEDEEEEEDIHKTNHARQTKPHSKPQHTHHDHHDHHHQNNQNNQNKKKKKKKNATSRARTSSSVPDQQESTQTTQKDTATTRNDESSSLLIDEILQCDDYYQILGLTQSTTNNDRSLEERVLQKAYRKRVLRTHPDKTGGDRRAFDKVAEAYQVLNDPQQKYIYDRYGFKGLQQHKNGGSPQPRSTGPEDLFRQFFSPPFQPQQQPQPQPPQPPQINRTARYQLKVTLEDLYHGTTRTVLVTPPPRHPFERRSSQPQPYKKVPVPIPPGAIPGQAIVLSGEMDFEPHAAPADLIFVLQLQSHSQFIRRNYDLAMTVPLRLSEALGGGGRNLFKTIPHIRGKPLRIMTTNNDHHHHPMIASGDVHVLKGWGMPKNQQRTEFGDLYLQFEVTLPQMTSSTNSSSSCNNLSHDERQELQRLLDKLEGVAEPSASTKDTSDLHKDDDDDDDYDEDVGILQPAQIRDFGVASGIPPKPSAPHQEDNEDESRRSSTQQFFYSSGMGRTNPFFGTRQGPMFPEDDENVQCRQM